MVSFNTGNTKEWPSEVYTKDLTFNPERKEKRSTVVFTGGTSYPHILKHRILIEWYVENLIVPDMATTSELIFQSNITYPRYIFGSEYLNLSCIEPQFERHIETKYSDRKEGEIWGFEAYYKDVEYSFEVSLGNEKVQLTSYVRVWHEK